MSYNALVNLFYLLVLIGCGYGIFYACLNASARREIGFRPAIIFSLLTATCLVAPNLWFVHPVFFLAAPIFARKREEVGLVLLAGLLATPSLGINVRLGSAYLFDYSVHTSLALGALVTLFTKRGSGIRRPFAADVPLLLLVVLLVFIGARETWLTSWLRTIAGVTLGWLIPYYVFTRSLDSAEGLRKALSWMTAAVTMLSVIVLFEVLRSWPLYSLMSQNFGVDTGLLEIKFRAGMMRAEGPLTEATALGFVLVIGFAAALVSRRLFGNSGKHYLILGLVSLSLLAPQSRGAWLGAGVAALAAALYRMRPGKGGALIGPSLAACVLAYGALTYGGEKSLNEGSIGYRTKLWNRGLEEFWKSPIFGDAPTTVVRNLKDLVQGEHMVDFVNSYLYFALMTGAIGLIAFVATMLLPLFGLWSRRGHLRPGSPERDFGAFAFASILAAVVMFAFTSFIARPALILMFIIGTSGAVLAARSSPRARARPGENALPATAVRQKPLASG